MDLETEIKGVNNVNNIENIICELLNCTPHGSKIQINTDNTTEIDDTDISSQPFLAAQMHPTTSKKSSKIELISK